MLNPSTSKKKINDISAGIANASNKKASESWRQTSVVLVGAAGAMGKCFTKLFATLPCKLFAVDFLPQLESMKKNMEESVAEISYVDATNASGAITSAQCVIFSLPLENTESTMKHILPLVKPGAMVLDLSSVKKPFCDLMESLTQDGVSVIGGHPLFGPYPNVSGETVVLVPGKNSDVWMEKLQVALDHFSLKVVVSTALQHDSLVAYSQALLHTMLFSFVSAIGKQGMTTEELIPFATPLYRFQIDLAARLLCQKSELYTGIALQNSKSLQAFTAMHEALGDFIELLKRQDFVGYQKKIESLVAVFSNVELANVRSKHLIEDEIAKNKPVDELNTKKRI